MPLLVQAAAGAARNPCWPDLASYRWMYGLPRLAWAWEFLRRDPGYRRAYNSAIAVTPTTDTVFDNPALSFGLRRFEDPDQDSLMANVFWRLRECREVLPLAASPMGGSTGASTLNLANLQCSTTVIPHGEEHRQDVLFAQDGRFL